ncbi:hypothetical protein DPMN_063610 [Dreissena polymorpha]|uniref:Uncharacterized protein n=1 Tax=Dreissena polymorpha TaxID=45954 RepID=A0A9D4CBS1_DREPO|nr:hypothetical protein DPMN_063610 [Dreissena polymorpha]
MSAGGRAGWRAEQACIEQDSLDLPVVERETNAEGVLQVSLLFTTLGAITTASACLYFNTGKLKTVSEPVCRGAAPVREEVEDLRSHHIIQPMSTRKIPSTASILIKSSWSKGTRTQYKYAWQNWVLLNGISPDLAPMDFRVFPEDKSQLRGIRFASKQELTVAAKRIVSSFDADWKGDFFLPVLKMIPVHLPATVNRHVPAPRMS